jgi:hypothetical protein
MAQSDGGAGEMRRWIPLLALCLLGAAPTRDNTYIPETIIDPDDVMANEDAIFEYLQDGVDTYAPNSITTNAIAVGGVTSSDILDGTITTTDLAFALNPGNTLPAGAVFFMLSLMDNGCEYDVLQSVSTGECDTTDDRRRYHPYPRRGQLYDRDSTYPHGATGWLGGDGCRNLRTVGNGRK